ncbi:MAG: hypothetical protein RLZ98_2883 [Pseudomonadota bacterium]
MVPNRRAFLGAGVGLGIVAAATPAAARKQTGGLEAIGRPASDFGIVANSGRNQTRQLQAAIEATRAVGQTLLLAPGRYIADRLELGPGTSLSGQPGRTTLVRSTPGPIIKANGSGIRISGLGITGAASSGTLQDFALLDIEDAEELVLEELDMASSTGVGIRLRRASGRIAYCSVHDVAGAAIVSHDADGLEIAHNDIADCADNGILVWQSVPREDGTIITGNRIARIGARSGGSGQYGNGINVFRAGNVLVTNNRISDCAYTAIRGNAASNFQVLGNSASRLGEVAIYAEFGFEAAIIANNLIEHAATGVAVTNFDHGGRLAVVQGNLVRHLVRREHEPVDKRGDGITVEADAAVTGNVIEDAANVGVFIGWGPYMRDVSATGNVIRTARVGIGITRDGGAGRALIAQNIVSGARDGAIRAFDHARAVDRDLAGETISGRITITGNLAS